MTKENTMRKIIAALFRRVAQSLDPQDEPQWFALYPTNGVSTTNCAASTYEWKAVGR